MEKTIKKSFGTQVDPGFKWKDRHGTFHRPKDMTTQHLFFTLRMIWNHSAPERMQIAPFKRYRFTDFYTTEYMVSAIRSITEELNTRNDLQPYFKAVLNMIKDHVRSMLINKRIEE